MKENDLADGQWSKWCETINMSSDYANKHIKVYEEFNNKSTSTSLPFNSLYEIASLPEPEHKTSFCRWVQICTQLITQKRVTNNPASGDVAGNVLIFEPVQNA